MLAQIFLILFTVVQLDVVQSKPLDNSFQASPFLSVGIPEILAHAAAARKRLKPIAAYPPDAGSDQRIGIYSDIRVSLLNYTLK